MSTHRPGHRFGARFGNLGARPPAAADQDFLDRLYLDARPDLGALPVPRGVIEAIARHQRQLQAEDYARRYRASEHWLVLDAAEPVAHVVLARTPGALRVVDLAVLAAARRRGVARSILIALQQERLAIALRVRAANAPARALYEKLGFTLRRDDGATLELGWEPGQNE